MTKLALLFPGQGTQYIGMGKKAVQQYPVAAQVFEEANDALGFDLKDLMFNGTMQELTHSANAQPAVVTVSYAYFKLYMQEFGIRPVASAGHSLGEISALIAAGGLSFSDGVKFARRRGFIMHEAFTKKTGSAGIARNMDEMVLDAVLSEIRERGEHVSISAYNSPVQFLISGTTPAISELSRGIRQKGGEFIPYKMVAMKVDAPFHCSIMSFLEDKLQKLLRKYHYSPLEWDVIANINARPYGSHHDIPTNLSLQLTHPVMWRQTLDALRSMSVTTALELGPMNVLKGLSEENTLEMDTYSWDMESDLEIFQKGFAEVS